MTGLTIISVQFDEDCGTSVIPGDALKHISPRFDFSFARTTLFFKHCYNLTLRNTLAMSDTYSYGVLNRISIIGVNLCGHSNIMAIMPNDFQAFPLVTMLMYYFDSNIVPADSKCFLQIETNVLSGYQHGATANGSLLHLLETGAEKLPVLPFRDLAIFVAQEAFSVDINVKILPMPYYFFYCSVTTCKNPVCAARVLIMFINSYLLNKY